MKKRWRVWDKKIKKMYYCDGLLDYNVDEIRIVKFTTDGGESWYNFAYEEMDRIVIMNNTGIFDYNGFPIYEGDVVWFCDDVYGVYLNEFRAAYMFCNDFDDLEFVDVDEEFGCVGNIFENPDWNDREGES